ncbi:hypothetical protein FIBSPDRAFT_799455 [Athelia psychrophila]|uniref:Uncharacterized protein n=1 Tax=Athelia psychrophila TaxID=1759441 RepID=A0A166AWK6_9AGAM|nr:hypothetical protein FIBSPDRAFT_799455 [Fibularhizoctonia sp. CBS 109695]
MATTTTDSPPYYILVSQSALAGGNGSPPITLGHPSIQYHYADDSPLALLPQSADEHVLILDHCASDRVPTMKSISRDLAVTGIRVSEAPGAKAAHDELKIKQNDKMYILETCSTTEADRAVEDASQSDLQSVQSILSRFKQRNGVLHGVLDYPDTSKGNAAILLTSSP